ncbi:MAG: hypothetical protein IRY99_18765 [Isosphaeraceae bacterium]|nr:hypothetical protein [Isosphaeraceae bacterium]
MQAVMSSSRRPELFQLGQFLVLRTERNTTPLFGAGRIDAIPEAAIEAVAQEQAASREFPEVRGRVCRLKDGRIGRFGWKGQIASLEDFVLTACAIELGLEVPNHPQARSPLAPEQAPRGLDLTAPECAALVAFVASLPSPVERAPSGPQEVARIEAGRASFERIGCAACHRPTMAGVKGLYSDLLLHQMGPALADSGSYGVDLPDSPEDAPTASSPAIARARAGDRNAILGATRQEWRTPPLWGLRDSGPYLHDGRAATLEQAIALHGGEGALSAERFFALPPEERSQLLSFLKSLVAPAAGGRPGPSAAGSGE